MRGRVSFRGTAFGISRLQQSGSGAPRSRADNTVEGNTTDTSGTIGTYTEK